MAKKGSLLSFRPDIKVVDATIRDGGLVNDFRFTDEFVKELCKLRTRKLEFHGIICKSKILI